jgi:hypothetical protein
VLCFSNVEKIPAYRVHHRTGTGINIVVAYLLKARNVEAEKQSLLGNGCVTRNNGVTVRIIHIAMLPCYYLSVYGCTVLLLDLGRFFNFVILYTVGRTSWTEDQPVARLLATNRTTQTQNKRTQISCLEWDSNLRSQRLSKRRRFMP